MALEAAPTPVRAVFETVAGAAPEIRAGLPGRRVKTDAENVSGERVLAADLWADELLGERLAGLDGVGEYGSEEREDVVDAGEGLSVAVDPLDGSSNLKSNNPMGTVVGVYDAPLPARGRDLVAAGFVLYGPITTMVVARDGAATEYVVEGGGAAAGEGAGESGATGPDDRTADVDETAADVDDRTADVDGRTVDVDERTADAGVTVRDVGDVELPEEPTVYGFGGRVPDWPADFAAYVDEVEAELKLRYGGAMIADVSQVLNYGGVFAYPGLRSRPEGKLRLQFEAAPIGYVVEAAGGASSDGERSLLDVEPSGLHARVPTHVGNEGLIDRLEAALGG